MCVGGGGVEGGGGSRVSVSGGGDQEHTARRRKMARDKLPNKPVDWQVSTYIHVCIKCN